MKVQKEVVVRHEVCRGALSHSRLYSVCFIEFCFGLHVRMRIESSLSSRDDFDIGVQECMTLWPKCMALLEECRALLKTFELKSHTFLYPDIRSQQALHSPDKETQMSPKEPYILLKEPYVSAKESYIPVPRYQVMTRENSFLKDSIKSGSAFSRAASDKDLNQRGARILAYLFHVYKIVGLFLQKRPIKETLFSKRDL